MVRSSYVTPLMFVVAAATLAMAISVMELRETLDAMPQIKMWVELAKELCAWVVLAVIVLMMVGCVVFLVVIICAARDDKSADVCVCVADENKEE